MGYYMAAHFQMHLKPLFGVGDLCMLGTTAGNVSTLSWFNNSIPITYMALGSLGENSHSSQHRSMKTAGSRR